MIPEPQPSDRSRRAFILEASTLSLAALGLPHTFIRRSVDGRRRGAPVRVRGRVTGGGAGLPRVGVTDGHTVVATDATGAFDLLTSMDRPYVGLSLPAGYRLPLQENGTVRHFVRLPALRTGAEHRVDFALERSPVPDERHAFVLCCDPQTHDAEEMARFQGESVPDLARTRRLIGDVPHFGVGCGDLMFDDLSLYPEYERGLRETGIPFFSVAGNHDLDQAGTMFETSTTTFESRFGPPWYSFNRGRVHYVVLHDVFWYGDGYLGYLPAEQLQWLQQDLALVPAGAPVVVFQHIPAGSTIPARTNDAPARKSNMVNNRAALYRLLEPYRAHVLAGHTHESEHIFTGNVHEHVGGAVCGGWWSGDICYDGTPNGYPVYEVEGERVTWRYQSTGKDAAHQMRVYAAGSDPTAPGDVVANIWDWDPQWRVVWYEGADRRGAMSRRTGLDPLAVETQAGPDKPRHNSWVDPVPTDHLFYAPASPGAIVRVEATDRFGRVHTGTL